MSAPAVPQDIEVRLGERDTSVSDKLATPGTLTVAQNVEMDKDGRYQRRPGNVLHSNHVESDFTDLESFDGGLVYSSPSGTRVYDEALGTWSAPAGAYGAGSDAFRLTPRIEGRATNGNQLSHSYVSAGGYDWHFWISAADTVAGSTAPLQYSVFEQGSGFAIIYNRLLDGSADNFAVSAYLVGTNIFVLYMEVNAAGTASTLRARKIPVATPNIPSAESTIDLTTVAGAAKRAFDAHIIDANSVTIAYKFDTAGTSRLRLRQWNVTTMASTAVATTAAATQGDDAITFLNATLSDGTYHVALAGPTGLTTQRHDIGTLALTSTATLDATFIGKAVSGYVDPSTNQEHVYAAEYTSGTTHEPLNTRFFTVTSGGAVSEVNGIRGISPASRPWVTASGRRYLLCRLHSNTQPTYVVLDPSLGAVSLFLGRFFTGVAHAYLNPVAGPTVLKETMDRMQIPYVTGDVAVIGVSRLAPNSTPGAPVSMAHKVTLTPRTAAAVNLGQAQGALIIPGGTPGRTDKGKASGWFHHFPDFVTFTAAAGTLTNGTYQVVAVYEDVDSRGNIYRSAPSVPQSHTTAVGGFRIDAPAPRLYESPAHGSQTTTIAFYRTAVNPGINPRFFFRGRIGIGSISGGATVTGITDNNINVADGEELYVLDGQVIENGPPPPLSQFTTWNGRGMYLLEENRRAFGWTKLFKEGVGIEFSEDFVGLIEDEYGDLTAQAPMGRRFVFFKRDCFYWIDGDGPDDLGNGEFTLPERVVGFPGTTNPRSVLSSEIGVFYQAPDLTMWLMGPGSQCAPLGDPVSDIASVIKDAVLVPDKRQARFYTASGTVLVYHLDRRRWTTFTMPAVSSVCVHDGAVFASLATPNAIIREDAATWADNGTTYQAILELAWLSLGKLAGYMRTWAIQLLGESLGAHTLSLQATADFGNATATRTLASTAIASAHGYRVEAKVPRQLQQETALKLRISDNSPTTAGFALEAINLQVGLAPGRRPRLPRAHRMG